VKDRHNGNILVDNTGHLIHIDFGFILGHSPAFNINFESAPFKLTREYLEVLGGVDSQHFKLFEDLFMQGFQALQKHQSSIVTLAEVSQCVVLIVYIYTCSCLCILRFTDLKMNVTSCFCVPVLIPFRTGILR
jgi:hypothetical protein